MQHISLFSIKIHNLTMHETLDHMSDLIEDGEFAYAVTPNVDHVIKLQKDADFREVYNNASLVLPDGVPLLWASRLLGVPLKERINGTDFFELACERAAERGYSVYLLGGSPGAAESACSTLKIRYPELRIAGLACPPQGFHENHELNEDIKLRIRRSAADILFVGLGAPKQENWMFHHAEQAGVRFAAGVGVSFSFVGGEIRRAPVWMQKAGTEWLWRLLKEPGRLWKRYLFGILPFARLLSSALLHRLVSASLADQVPSHSEAMGDFHTEAPASSGGGTPT